MPRERRRFTRPLAVRRYRKLYVIATEGSATEPQYFGLFNSQNSTIQTRCVFDKSTSAPVYVLNRMKRHLREEGLRRSDEAWLVVDRDHWSDGDLAELHRWSTQGDNYGFALSNPKFEFWLLLHFEDGTGVGSAHECDRRLRNHVPNYEKHIDPRHFTLESINEAVGRAERRDSPPCTDWPRTVGSTVYRLVRRILEAGDE